MREKIREQLSTIPHISAEIDLAASTVEISSEKEIDLSSINEKLKTIGNYAIEDPEDPNKEFLKPEDKVSPSSVYYCPMECEGENSISSKEPDARCVTCTLYLLKKEKQ